MVIAKGKRYSFLNNNNLRERHLDWTLNACECAELELSHTRAHKVADRRLVQTNQTVKAKSISFVLRGHHLTQDNGNREHRSVSMCVCGCVSANTTRADHYRIKTTNVWKAAPRSCGETSLSSVTRRDIQQSKRKWHLLTHFDWNKYTVYIFWVHGVKQTQDLVQQNHKVVQIKELKAS